MDGEEEFSLGIRKNRVGQAARSMFQSMRGADQTVEITTYGVVAKKGDMAL